MIPVWRIIIIMYYTVDIHLYSIDSYVIYVVYAIYVIYDNIVAMFHVYWVNFA